MKLGIITDEISQDFPHALAVAREIGCTGVELRSLWDTGLYELSSSRVRTVRALLDEHALECYNIAGPVFKCDLASQREIAQHFDILKRCCDAAHELGAPNVRAFTFWREPSAPVETVWGRIVELVARAAEVAAEAERTLAIENEHDTYVGGGRMLARLFDEVEPDNVRAIWDPANVVFDPDAEPPYPEGFEAVRERLALCHIKDAAPAGKSAKCVPVGEGDAMLAELLARLTRDAYAGYLSLETHWRPEGELDEQTLRMPGGQAFSAGPAEGLGGAEAASRICMANLRRLLDEKTDTPTHGGTTQ